MNVLSLPRNHGSSGTAKPCLGLRRIASGRRPSRTPANTRFSLRSRRSQLSLTLESIGRPSACSATPPAHRMLDVGQADELLEPVLAGKALDQRADQRAADRAGQRAERLAVAFD